MKNNYNYLILFILISVSVYMLSSSLSYQPNSGNKAFDNKLERINENAIGNLNLFITNTSQKYNVPTKQIEKLISNYEPAEVLAIFELSEILEQNMFSVFEAYDSNDRNWKTFFSKNKITDNQYKHLINLDIPNTTNKKNPISSK